MPRYHRTTHVSPKRLAYEDSDEYHTYEYIESHMSMNDDDDGERSDRLNAVVTKAKITAMDSTQINALSKIASSFVNVTTSL